MALSDCAKCYDTPCSCGYNYEHWTSTQLKNHIDMLQIVLDKKVIIRSDSLASFFGLSYASWLTLPRVLMEDMNERWQRSFGNLLKEFAEEFPNVDLTTRVSLVNRQGKFRKMERWLNQYRHPDKMKLEEARRKQ